MSTRPELMWVDCGSDGRAHIRQPRTGIRSHAMKLAATARKGRRYGQQNRGQALPPRRRGEIDHLSPDLDSPESAPGNRQWCPHAPYIPHAMPLVGLERLNADTGIDVMDLAGLANYHVGQSMSALLLNKPSRLVLMLNRQKPSYLTHVPSRYGHSTCLDDALRCVAMKTKRHLRPNNQVAPPAELAAYGQALRSLRQAVEQGQHILQPDVICANQLLCLAEILDFRIQPWQHHTEATARLFILRGPQGIQTEFEKDLLASMLGVFVCEALRTGQPCFLGEEPWQDVLDSLVDPTYPWGHYRSAITMANFKPGARLPRLMGRIPHIVHNPEHYTDKDVEDLETQIRTIKTELDATVTTIETFIIETLYDTAPAQGLDERLEMLGAIYTILFMTCRNLGTISGERRASDEELCVAYAKKTRQLLKDTEPVNPCASLYLQQIVNWLNAVFDTTDDWMAPPKEPRMVIEHWKFRKWKNLMDGGATSQRAP